MLLGTPITVGRILSGVQLALWYDCCGTLATPRSTPTGRGKLRGSASEKPGPTGSIRDSNCSARSYGRQKVCNTHTPQPIGGCFIQQSIHYLKLSIAIPNTMLRVTPTGSLCSLLFSVAGCWGCDSQGPPKLLWQIQ